MEPAANRPPTRADLSGLSASVGAEVHALHRHDVALPTGCGGTVGIAGLTLGGGLGILGRQ